MPLSRENLERQLAQAQVVLQQAAAELKEQGVSDKELRRQPKWRKANAAVRQLKTRLGTVSAKEALSAASDSEE